MSWNYKGHNIDVNRNGAFEVEMSDDLTLTAPSLEELKQKIDKAKRARVLDLKVVGILNEFLNSPMEVLHSTLIGVNRTDRTLRFAGVPKDRSFTAYVMPDTPENTALMERLLAVLIEKEHLTKKIAAVGLGNRLGYGRVERDDVYEELLEQLETRYNGQEVK